MRYYITGHSDLTQEEFNTYYIPEIQYILQEDRNSLFYFMDYGECDKLALKFFIDNNLSSYRVFPRDYFSGSFTQGVLYLIDNTCRTIAYILREDIWLEDDILLRYRTRTKYNND